MRELTEQELVRRSKIDRIVELGIDPFGQRFDVTMMSMTIKEKYDSYTKEELHDMNIEVSVAGRIMTKRDSGKAGFMHIQDKEGQIQIYLRKDVILDEQYELFEQADLGDIVGIFGYVFKTNTGELSVKALKYTHLVKALRPLPEKYHGLTDIEERYRRRYVDLIMNEDARKIAFTRPKIIRSIQSYLDKKGYVEVETPILGTILGGAAAKPFATHHNTLELDMYLRIATELPLKRLLVGGMDAVYEIGRLFRNEGMDKNHNPEFTTIELYKAYSDLDGMMDLCEGLFRNVLNDINASETLSYKGHDLDFTTPWKRCHMVDLINEKCGVNFFENITIAQAKEIAKQHNVEIEEHYEFGHIVNAFYEKYVEETNNQPTKVLGHPIEISPLAKKDMKDPRFTQRFELFICGSEYANAFTELNDPIDQQDRFLNQLKQRTLGNEEANDMDEDFIDALEYGMPPAGGMGIGIDRLVMLVTSSLTIREVILFPHMKPRE